MLLWSTLMSAVLFGKWTDHVKSWKRSELGDRILFITYEEMVEVMKQSSAHVAMAPLKRLAAVPERAPERAPQCFSTFSPFGQLKNSECIIDLKIPRGFKTCQL